VIVTETGAANLRYRNITALISFLELAIDVRTLRILKNVEFVTLILGYLEL
jgi:hypothetical protein